MRRIFLIVVLLLFGGITFAQTGKTRPITIQGSIKPLKVAEKVPDFIFEEMLNYGSSSAKLSDFKGKLVILDFWNIHCATCIKEFPKLQFLQKRFKDSLAIITIGINSLIEPTGIQTFIKKREGTKNEILLPTAVIKLDQSTFMDNILYKLFPWRGVPHEVWIDKDGVLIGITDHKAVTLQNIDSILNGHRFIFTNIKKKHVLNVSEPFLLQKKTQFGSAFTAYIDTLHTTPYFSESSLDTLTLRYININQTIINYYTEAYLHIFPELYDDPYGNRVYIESDNRNRFRSMFSTLGMDNWEFDSFSKDNLYCYELIVPKSWDKMAVTKKLIKDLDNYFNIHSEIKDKKVSCYILKRIDGNANFISKNDTYAYDASLSNDTFNFKKFPITSFVRFLKSRLKDGVVLDETGYSGNIDLELKMEDPKELSSWKKNLNAYGLDIVKEDRIIPCLVLSDQ